MKKTIKISENVTNFEINALTPFYYKSEFNSDFFGDMIKMSDISDGQNLSASNLKTLDFNVFTQMAWACAKTADEDNTPGFYEWLRANKDFNVFTDGMEIMNLITESMDTEKK